MSKKNKMMVTGVTLTTDGGVSLGRDKKGWLNRLFLNGRLLMRRKGYFSKDIYRIAKVLSHYLLIGFVRNIHQS